MNQALKSYPDYPGGFLSIELDREQFFWLREGANYVGSHQRNQVQLDTETAAGFVCVLFLDNDSVFVRVAAGEVVTQLGKHVENKLVYTGTISIPLLYKNLTIKIIREGRRYAVLVTQP